MRKVSLAFLIGLSLFFVRPARAAAPARLSQFGYADVMYRNMAGEVNYLAEVSDSSNFFYVDLSNLYQPGMTENQRQQKLTEVFSQARSRGMKVMVNVSYYFLESDPAYRTRPAYKLASCFSTGQDCPRWQADAPLLKSTQADILSFVIADRPNYYLVKKSDQSAIADKLHVALPGVPVMASYVLDGRLDTDKKCEVTDAYNDVPLMFYYGPNREDCVAYDSIYGIPENLDWLSLTAYNLGHADLVEKYWSQPLLKLAAAFPNKPFLPVVESFSDHLNRYGATMDNFQTYGISKRRADGDTISWYLEDAKTGLNGLNILGFLYYSYGGLNIGQPARGDGAILNKQKDIFSAQSTLPIIRSFKADPAAVNPNVSSVLSWEVSGAGAAQIAVNGRRDGITGSSLIVNPTATTTYTLSATNAFGTATRSVLVTVLGSGAAEQPAQTGTNSPTAPKDGTLVNDKGTIYVLENGRKRPIATMRVFNSFGYRLSNVIKSDLSGVPAGEPLLHENQRHARGSLVVSAGTVYFLGANLRYPFTSAQVFSAWGCAFKDVLPANQYDLDVPIGPPVDNP